MKNLRKTDEIPLLRTRTIDISIYSKTEEEVVDYDLCFRSNKVGMSSEYTTNGLRRVEMVKHILFIHKQFLINDSH